MIELLVTIILTMIAISFGAALILGLLVAFGVISMFREDVKRDKISKH